MRWAEAHPDSAIYQALEWDDTKAAREWRLHQITMFISVHVVDDKGFRTMVSLSVDRVAGGGYRDRDTVLCDQTMREILLKDALADAERFQSRYNTLREMARVCTEMKAAKKRATRKGAKKKAA